MRFKNLETGTILEVPKENKERIEKFRGYPDKFQEIGEVLSHKVDKKIEDPKVEDPKVPAENEKKEDNKEPEKKSK